MLLKILFKDLEFIIFVPLTFTFLTTTTIHLSITNAMNTTTTATIFLFHTTTTTTFVFHTTITTTFVFTTNIKCFCSHHFMGHVICTSFHLAASTTSSKVLRLLPQRQLLHPPIPPLSTTELAYLFLFIILFLGILLWREEYDNLSFISSTQPTCSHLSISLPCFSFFLAWRL